MADYNALKPLLRGELIQPCDGNYDDARKLYNAMIDKKPAAIARCVDVADVMACVNHARSNGILLAVRGGGHSGPGLGSCDSGLVIDLSRMRGVRVDPDARTAQVAGGCVWGDVDHATHPFGLAAASGIISTTGELGQGLLGRGAPLFGARRICQLHDGRRDGTRGGDVRRQLSQVAGNQGQVRPGESVPGESEYCAVGVGDGTGL
jgi:hypothetical protein